MEKLISRSETIISPSFNLPPKYTSWFQFQLNLPQQEVGRRIFGTSENILVIAPTGAGKTAIGELAIIKELIRKENKKRKGPIAIILVPLKAITSERIRIWEKRQSVKVVVATAETAIGITDILESDIVISVPEKIDSITRSSSSEIKGFFESIRVLVVDEVHLLDMDGRGDALEAVMTRFLTRSKTRIIALSATVPNFEDVALWLHIPSTGIFRYGDELRPVQLKTRVLTYNEGESLAEDQQRQDKLVLEKLEIVLRENRQTIIFVNSRKGTERLAKKIVHYWDKKGIHG
ncbi:MAG: DEAD/DEAH box helicase, partial [Candidatus Hodarchaeota archaeon]